MLVSWLVCWFVSWWVCSFVGSFVLSFDQLFQNSSREHRKRARLSKRAIKLMYVIVIAFFVCQLPVNIFFAFEVFEVNKLPSHFTVRLYFLLHTLQLCTNCVNPLVYCKLHHYFAHASWGRLYRWFVKLCVCSDDVISSHSNGIHGSNSPHGNRGIHSDKGFHGDEKQTGLETKPL